MPNLSRDEVYDNGEMMAPGGLLLAQTMAERLELKAGETVLDLGCGRGQTSAYLARDFGVNVVSVDLWISNAERLEKARQFGVETAITPLQGDVRRGLPKEFGNFDAIFAMQSFHTFGTTTGILNYLASLLKTGGRICIAQTCFDNEPVNLPDLYRQTNGWHAEYEKYHSPDWWRSAFETSGRFQVEFCEEISDGKVMWEDHVLYWGERSNWSEEYLEETAWLIRQLIWGKTNSPALTHFVLSATKN